MYLLLNLESSWIFWFPLYHCISALGLARTLNFMVTSVPLSLGIILGFSVKVGGMPSSAEAAAVPSSFGILSPSSTPFSLPAIVQIEN